MIAYLLGQIKHKSAIPKKDNFVIVDVGGVGYKAFVLDRVINDLQIGEELELYTYTQVAETALDLYGFVTMEELGFFEILISISGVGPKSAINILQKAKIEDLKAAAESGSADVLSQVSGIGAKTAEKIVTGLRNKIGSIESSSSPRNEGFGEALEALVGLGYSAAQARDALSHSKATETGAKIKEALKVLGNK